MGGVSSLEVNGIEVYRKIPDYQEFLNVTTISESDFLNKVCIADTFNDNVASQFVGKTVLLPVSGTDKNWKIIGYNHDNSNNTFDLLLTQLESSLYKKTYTSTDQYAYNGFRYTEAYSAIVNYTSNLSSDTKAKRQLMTVYDATGDYQAYVKVFSLTEIGVRQGSNSYMPATTEGTFYGEYFTNSNKTFGYQYLELAFINQPYWLRTKQVVPNDQTMNGWYFRVFNSTSSSQQQGNPSNEQPKYQQYLLPIIRLGVTS